MNYDDDFFDTIREGCKRSAAAVVPAFLKHYSPESVVDVGCGEGWWGRAFEEAGCSVLGIDGDYAKPVIAHEVQDLAAPMRPSVRFHPQTAKFDLAVCLEVAEHLPPERAESFIAELCDLAPIVLFSAAIPGQGGVNHLNEQWPAYWDRLFERHSFEVTGDFRWEIWNDDRVENWYRQNILIACHVSKRSVFSAFSFEGAAAIVHPVLFDARRT